MPGGMVLSPAWLKAELLSIAPTLTWLGVGSSLPYDASSWPGLIGNPMAPMGAAVNSVATENGFRVLVADGSTTTGLSIDTGTVVKTVIAVARTTSLPFSGYQFLVGYDYNDSATEMALIGILGASAWNAFTGHTFYRNGLVQRDVQQALSVYTATNSGSNRTRLDVICRNGTYQVYNGSIACAAAASTVLTPQQILSASTVLKAYYRIP